MKRELRKACEKQASIEIDVRMRAIPLAFGLRSDSEGKHCRRGWAELQLGAATKPDHGRYAFFDRFKTQRDTSRPFQTSVNCSALGATRAPELAS